MGHLEFEAKAGNDDASEITPNSKKEHLTVLCELLDVAPSDFEIASTERTMVARDDVYQVWRFALCVCVCVRDLWSRAMRPQVPLNPEQATSAVASLAKEMYARVFNWVVEKINLSTSATISTAASSNHTTSKTVAKTISLLDIFGFESFKVNSFEQFCINCEYHMPPPLSSFSPALVFQSRTRSCNRNSHTMCSKASKRSTAKKASLGSRSHS
jgi:myosin-5